VHFAPLAADVVAILVEVLAADDVFDLT